MLSCMKNPHVQQARQTLLNLQPLNHGPENGTEIGTLTAWKFDQGKIRQAVAYMIAIDELPFKFVEGDGFKKVMNEACPRFRIPSRWTVSRDCFDLYDEESKNLKSFMKSSCQRISLTADT